METNILTYLPDWFRQITDFTELMDTGTAELEALAAAVDAVHGNFYIQTADEGTVRQYETIFGIVPDPSTETLDFRRARVLNRLSMQPPFTLPFLKERLDQIIGAGRWELEVDYGAYTIYIAAAAENQAWATELAWTLNTVKPCHIVYIIRPVLRPSVTADETVSLTERVYNYKLGAWGLGVNPFSSRTDKGVIVTADQQTVQSAYLADIAGFAAEDVASARINGTVAITGLEKSSSGNLATVTYSVAQSQAAEITQVELLSSSGAVLTSAPVYVPVTSETVELTHRITIEEG